MKELLELNQITTTVNLGTPEQKDILTNLNLKINEGDFITLLGTNGAGKSTLLNVINGSIIPSKGKITLLNHELTKLSEVKRAKFIAQVFQDPKLGTAPRMTVSENLLLATKRGEPRTLHFRNLRKKIDVFKQLTSQLPNGLNKHLNTPTGDLSGGQRQTLSFLMATINNPKILLLDEHTAALDPKTSHQLLELTKKVITKKHLTCIMITHNLKDALTYGNRTIILKDGKIVLDIANKKREHLTEEQILTYFA